MYGVSVTVVLMLGPRAPANKAFCAAVFKLLASVSDESSTNCSVLFHTVVPTAPAATNELWPCTRASVHVGSVKEKLTEVKLPSSSENQAVADLSAGINTSNRSRCPFCVTLNPIFGFGRFG